MFLNIFSIVENGEDMEDFVDLGSVALSSGAGSY